MSPTIPKPAISKTRALGLSLKAPMMVLLYILVMTMTGSNGGQP